MKTIILVFFLFSFNLFAQSMTKSCSGTMRYCDDYGFCTDEYYYIYAYQYVKFFNGELKRHRNRFNFRGFVLGEEDDYSFSGVYTPEHLIYSGPSLDLAIPWDKSIGIYSINRVSGEWTLLCQ